MSHFILQTAPIPTAGNTTLPLKPSVPTRQLLRTCKPWRRGNLVIECLSPPLPPPMNIDGADQVAALERCYLAPAPPLVASGKFGPTMKGKYGAFGAVTLEKGKLDMSQKQSQSSPEVALGGGGGDIGKKINHGGGDGGDDDGDDDDYFDDFDDDDEGDEGGLFRRRQFLQEVGKILYE
uniref:Uncharacterized protein MANES_10G130100 n=1 Tax=Rhizophora mucronata TaxID=61149 RepID=A0A2P2K405_RHIMU